MAKPTTIKIRLNSTAGTGHFYVTKKNARTMTEKMTVRKYDPVVRKHVEYKEGKIKYAFPKPDSVDKAMQVSCVAFLFGGWNRQSALRRKRPSPISAPAKSGRVGETGTGTIDWVLSLSRIENSAKYPQKSQYPLGRPT